ncbi:MAG: MFS transporter [Actinomycetota bacterium]|nr:MFS transporter [Actinomycetota bacterium]
MSLDVFGNPDLRRVELAFIGFTAAEWGTWIAIMVFAYEASGVAAAAGIGVIQLIPAAIFAPFASVLGDRYRRERILLAGYLLQAVAVGATAAALLAQAPVPAIYALAALVATSITLTRPAQGSLLPSLARTPEELTAANVAVGWIESLSMFGGPALTGVLLGVSGPGVVFVAMSGALLCSALMVARIQARSTPAPGDSLQGTLGELLGGFHALVGERQPRLVIYLMGAHFIVEGTIDVLFVVLSFRILDLGSAGVGFLNAAFGVGGIVGAALTMLLVARRRLAPPLFGGAAAWGTALVAIGLFPNRIAAPFLVGVAGVGRPLIDVAGRTLLQRVVPDRVLSRVFGVLEGLYMAGLAVGLALIPALFALIGVRATFVVCGAFLPVLFLLLSRRLSEVDASSTVPEAQLALLRSLPIFAPLPAPAIERVASRLIPIEESAGTPIVRQGEPGDRFYIIVDGEVTVSRDDRSVASLGGGDFFGEIALLRNAPRNATVTARTSVRLYALERDDFLEVVTGHPQSAAAADAVARKRHYDHGS